MIYLQKNSAAMFLKSFDFVFGPYVIMMAECIMTSIYKTEDAQFTMASPVSYRHNCTSPYRADHTSYWFVFARKPVREMEIIFEHY